MAAFLFLAACEKGTATAIPPPPPPAPPLAAPTGPSGPGGKYTWKDLQPVFAEDCDRCHGANPRPGNWVAKAKKKFDTSRYPFGGELGAQSLDSILEVLEPDASGRRKMPMDQKLDYPDERAQKIVKWIMDGALDSDGKSPVWPQ
jgi:hypothetical protein